MNDPMIASKERCARALSPDLGILSNVFDGR